MTYADIGIVVAKRQKQAKKKRKEKNIYRSKDSTGCVLQREIDFTELIQSTH